MLRPFNRCSCCTPAGFVGLACFADVECRGQRDWVRHLSRFSICDQGNGHRHRVADGAQILSRVVAPDHVASRTNTGTMRRASAPVAWPLIAER